MSSGFISEAELAEQRRLRQEQWEKVRKPGQPEECPEEEYDHRSLFERLEEQKRKRELEYEEAHKLKNMIKGLDDDEVEFLDLVDRSKLEEERRKSAEEAREINDFRNAVASLQERSLEERIQSEIRTRPIAQTGSTGMRSSQMRLLAGAVVRKRPADATQEVNEKKARTENKAGSASMNGNASKEESKTDAVSSNTLKAKCEEETKGSELPKKRKNANDEVENDDSSSVGLRCIGILPGLGSYPDSSDSEQSSDTDQEFNVSGTFDLLGRKIIRQSKSKSTSSVSSYITNLQSIHILLDQQVGEGSFLQLLNHLLPALVQKNVNGLYLQT